MVYLDGHRQVWKTRNLSGQVDTVRIMIFEQITVINIAYFDKV